MTKALSFVVCALLLLQVSHAQLVQKDKFIANIGHGTNNIEVTQSPDTKSVQQGSRRRSGGD
jgi:hypothetical protein